MKIKETLKKNFWDKKSLTLKRFKSAKFIFTIMWLLFFINYFLLAHFSSNNFLIIILPSIYIGFITSLLFLSYYSIKNKFYWKLNRIFLFVFSIFLIIIWLILSTPFLIDNDLVKNIFTFQKIFN